MRLDQFITDKLKISKNKAQAIIKSGNVKVDGAQVKKTGFEVKSTNIVEFDELEQTKYVARSAMKLKGFLDEYNLKITDFICLDIGSSTGGFCQILLENDVKKITAVDVGTSQLHETLRGNNKIIIRENTDIRKLEKLDEKLDLITCDVSFISLEMILESIIFHMSENTISLLLFKPQFEVGKQHIGKKGVVLDEKISDKKINDFLQICRDNGLQILKVEKSKLEGENGNKEIFVMLKKK
ncbi:MAG: TlyA family RNA methyltransferase [Candidatus Gracilibacteria bacterium]|nr:TlyA family RNA methyltransferase [Candidatus Gracilibacteria bacterium]